VGGVVTDEPLARLTDFFDPHDVQWRIAATTSDKARGQAVPYIDARTVMDRLDEAVGPASWSDEYSFGPNGAVLCRLSIRLDGEWVAKSDGAELTQQEPVKGGVSDALKRAAAKWGVGRYLHRFPDQWVPIVARGKSHVFAEGHYPQVPRWAVPTRLASVVSTDANRPAIVFDVPTDANGAVDWAAVWRSQPLGMTSLAGLKERSGDANAHRWSALQLAEFITPQG
jgi:hypothetical protein